MQKQKVASSLALKFVENFLAKGMGLVISILLARLISPDDFGQLAIITVFINLSYSFIHSGLSQALVQKKDVDDLDYSTVFYISLTIAVILTIVLILVAPFIGNWYKSSSLVAPLRFYAISLLFGAFNSIQSAKMQKEMQFKNLLISRIITVFLSGAIGVFAAYKGMGLWALVIYNFSVTVIGCLAHFIYCKWIPKLAFSTKRAKGLFNYGWKILVSGLLFSLYSDLRTIIIGKKYSTEDLGYYDRGKQVPTIFATTIDGAVQGVMFPTMASVQDQKEQVRAILKRTLTLGALIIIPFMAGLALLTRPFISVFYGDKWLPATFFMQVYCITEMLVPLYSSTQIVIKALGRSDIYMKLEVVRRIASITVLLIAVFGFNSLNAIAISMAIGGLIDYILVTIPVKKLLGYGFFQQVFDIWKIILATAIMSAVVYLVGFIQIHAILLMLVQAVIGVAVYVLAIVVLREKNFFYLLNSAKEMLNKKKESN